MTTPTPPAGETGQRRCWHGHTKRKVGCVSCVAVFDWPAENPDWRNTGPALTFNAAAPSAGAGAQEAALLSAFRAGFQWGIDGTDKYGEYNGGPVDDGFTQFLATHAATPAEPMPPPPPPDTLDREALVKLENAIRAAWQAGWFAALGYEAGEHRDCELHVDSALARLRAPTPTGEPK